MTLYVDPLTLSASYLGDTFSHTITVQDRSEVIPATDPITYDYVNITSCTVVPYVGGVPYYEDTVNINIAGVGTTTVTVTISGYYQGVFDQNYWQYKTTADGSIITSSYNDIPAHIFALTRYHPDLRPTITVSYLITANSSSETVTKIINNNWTYMASLIGPTNCISDMKDSNICEIIARTNIYWDYNYTESGYIEEDEV